MEMNKRWLTTPRDLKLGISQHLALPFCSVRQRRWRLGAPMLPHINEAFLYIKPSVNDLNPSCMFHHSLPPKVYKPWIWSSSASRWTVWSQWVFFTNHTHRASGNAIPPTWSIFSAPFAQDQRGSYLPTQSQKPALRIFYWNVLLLFVVVCVEYGCDVHVCSCMDMYVDVHVFVYLCMEKTNTDISWNCRLPSILFSKTISCT